MTTQRAVPPAIETFVGRLEEMAQRDRPDRASLARLKRGAGRSLGECGALMPLFYRLAPSWLAPWEEEDYFLVSTLFPFAPRRWTGDLGASLRLLRSRDEINEDGLDRRVAILLDAGRAELVFRLRQVVGVLAQKELALDWRQLLTDLRWWESPERRVQKRWARSYFGWTRDEEASDASAAETAEPETE